MENGFLYGGKVIASVFWDAKGILLVVYMEEGKTIGTE